jgi:hypothetical protein
MDRSQTYAGAFNLRSHVETLEHAEQCCSVFHVEARAVITDERDWRLTWLL